MSHTRQPLDPEEWGVLIGCSTCGGRYHWPQEIGRTSDHRYQCFRYCWDNTNALEDSQRIANARRDREETNFCPPGAPFYDYGDA